jgi:hypothetical protein
MNSMPRSVRVVRATRTSVRKAAPLLHRIFPKDLSTSEYGRHVLETGAEHPHQLETGALEFRVPCVWWGDVCVCVCVCVCVRARAVSLGREKFIVGS